MYNNHKPILRKQQNYIRVINSVVSGGSFAVPRGGNLMKPNNPIFGVKTGNTARTDGHFLGSSVLKRQNLKFIK